MNVVASLRSFGIASLFCWRVLLKVLNGRVLKFIGETVRQIRGREFYEDIGRKGGQKVRELINAAKKAE